MLEIGTKDLKRLGVKMGKRAEESEQKAKRVVAESTMNIESEAKLRAAVSSGKLRSSIGHRFEDNGLTGVVEATAEHAAYVEYNTRPHIIRAKKAKFLRFKMNGQWVFRRSVKHPGTTEQPFMRPALRAERPNFVKGMAEIVRSNR